jgi:hypothetical protein
VLVAEVVDDTHLGRGPTRAEHLGSRLRRRFLSAQARKPVTLADLQGRELPTLRSAILTIEAYGGEITASGGALRIDLPERLTMPTPAGIADYHCETEARQVALEAARVIDAGRELVMQALARRSKHALAERVPDKPVLAGGST